MFTLYTDGGSRGNPGPAAIGAVGYQDGEELFRVSETIGVTTNNQAEYRALLRGLTQLLEETSGPVICYLDSELVVRQLTGVYRMKNPDLKPLYDQVRTLVSRFESVRFEHVLRDKNKVADSLVNAALDREAGRESG